MTPELRRIASRVVWWDTPEHVVVRLDDFLCRVMALGDLADANDVEQLFGADRLWTALASAPAGILDTRSWHAPSTTQTPGGGGFAIIAMTEAE